MTPGWIEPTFGAIVPDFFFGFFDLPVSVLVLVLFKNVCVCSIRRAIPVAVVEFVCL